MKNPNDPMGNLTGDLPVCSAVPQPTARTRARDIHALETQKSAVMTTFRPVYFIYLVHVVLSS
jgi:hypothetical protein